MNGGILFSIFATLVCVACFAAGWRACERQAEEEANEARIQRLEKAAGIPVESLGRDE